MALDTKNKPITSPRLRFSWPKLTNPDTKFKAEGEYSVSGIADADDPAIKALMKKIDEAAAASLAEAKDKAKSAAEKKKWETKYLPYSLVEDEDTGEQTGEVKFKFTMRASGVSKKTGKPWKRSPKLFDAKGKPLKAGIEIGGGTIGKINFEIVPYAQSIQTGASVKLSMEAVQIIELKEFGDRSAESYGFSEEDGYEAEEGSTEEETFSNEATDDDWENGDF